MQVSMQVPSSLTADCGPQHLTQVTLRALSVSVPNPPEEALLFCFFSALYEASFRSSQGAPLQGRVIWHTPSDLETADDYLHLTPPVPFSAGSLTALLAGVKSPSVLLVGQGDDISPLVILGIAASALKLTAPPVLSAELLGPAHLKVEAGLDYPLELRRNRLHLPMQNVFGRGPVQARLFSLLGSLFPAVQTLLPAEIAGSPFLTAGSFPLPGGGVLLQEQQDWPETLTQFWIGGLVLLLAEISELRRSSLVLLTPRRDLSAVNDPWLTPPHEAVYPQLRRLLEHRASAAIVRQVETARSLSAALLHEHSPEALVLQEPILPKEALAGDAEITGAARLLASLAQEEGPLRLTPQLELLSFGGQPSVQALPERVYLAEDETGAALALISSRSFGPRNQALLSLCYQDPDALGFAFTQDGDLRAMLRQGDKLIVWNSIYLPPR